MKYHQIFLILILTLINFLPILVNAKKLYEQSCSTTEDCNQTLGLTCQYRSCKCAQNGETVYSLSKNRCVGAAGRECLKIGNSETYNINETLCVDNSICQNYGYMHLCTCRNGFYQSKDGNCYSIAKYGESCIEEEFSCGDTVSTSISCVDKKCRCLLGEENQYFDAKANRCVSYAGGQCIYNHNYNSNNYHCGINSFCGEVSENIHGSVFVIGHKCLCNAGYSYTKNRQCLGRYGTDCGADNPCNYDEYLGCLNGKCQCRNPLNEVYDEKTRKCSILVSSFCKIEDDSQKCVENAECLPEKNTTKNKHFRCQCLQGYSTTPLNTCLLDINEKCKANQCNHFNALTCVNSSCSCIDSNLSYDKASKSCVSLIGLPCGTVTLFEEGIPSEQKTEITVLCEANASCSKINGVVAHNGATKRVCKPTSSKS